MDMNENNDELDGLTSSDRVKIEGIRARATELGEKYRTKRTQVTWGGAVTSVGLIAYAIVNVHTPAWEHVIALLLTFLTGNAGLLRVLMSLADRRERAFRRRIDRLEAQLSSQALPPAANDLDSAGGDQNTEGDVNHGNDVV